MRRAIPALLLLVFLAAPVAGQDTADPESGGLSLAEALESARENNPAFRIARSDLDLAEIRDRGLWSYFMPSLALGWSTGMSQSRRYTGVDEFGQPVERDDPLIYTSSGSSQSVAVGQITLFDGGRTFAVARADRASADVLRSGVAAEAARLETQLTQKYYEAVVADAEIALAERMLESARETLEGTKRLFRIGMRDPVDQLGAELLVAEREHAVEQARGAARIARLALGQEMGVGREVEGALVDGLPAGVDPAALNAEALVDRAISGNPRIASLSASAVAAEHRLGAARGGRWPSVAVGFSTNRNIGGSGSDAFFDLQPRDQNYGVNLSFRIPLFTQFQTADAIAEARVATVAADETLRAGQLEIETQIRGALIDLENAYRDIQLAERTAELSRQRLALAREKYQLGGATFDELRTASEDNFQREHAVLTARHRFASAQLAVEEAAGVEIP